MAVIASTILIITVIVMSATITVIIIPNIGVN